MAYRISLSWPFSRPVAAPYYDCVRGGLAYKCPSCSVSSPQSLPVLGASVVASSWDRSGREDGVYQPVSTSGRAGLPRGGRRVAELLGGHRGCRVGQSAPEVRGEAADWLADPDKGTSRRQGCQGCRRGYRAVGVTIPMSWLVFSPRHHPAGAPVSPAPGFASLGDI